MGKMRKSIDEEWVACGFCGVQISRLALVTHTERKHKCGYCGKQMPETVLSIHVDQMHTPCGVCGQRMPKANLLHHFNRMHPQISKRQQKIA